MEILARVTSKGQTTIPKAIRDALQLSGGDTVMFRLEDERVTMTPAPDFFELAGSVSTPDDVRGMSWDEIRERAWTAGWRAAEGRE